MPTLGTVSLPVSFSGERAVYTQKFRVLERSMYDIILGSPFLQLTNISRMLRGFFPSGLMRLCCLGESTQRLGGWLNGEFVEALPDTGSDVTLISSEYAKAGGFEVI